MSSGGVLSHIQLIVDGVTLFDSGTPTSVPPPPPQPVPTGVRIIDVSWPQGESTQPQPGHPAPPNNELLSGEVVAFRISKALLVGKTERGFVSFYEANPKVTCEISNVAGQFGVSTNPHGHGVDRFTPRVNYCIDTMPDWQLATLTPYAFYRLPPPDAQGNYFINVKGDSAGSFFLFYTNA